MKCFVNLAILLFMCNVTLAFICSRYPAHTVAPKSPVDENFAIFVHGNPQTYMLGAEYKITLEAFNGARFVVFMLALENGEGDMNYNDDLGKFEIVDDVETRYSANCFNMIESTNTNPKTHIEVKWIAPSEPGTGCVLIRATVLQSRDVWFMDDGGLTRQICEEIADDVESKTINVDDMPCCACDEASYEIIFEGSWSRNLHPKYFPPMNWVTRFGDIIGASHTSDYRFWEYGQLATEGMQEYAEHGSLRLLQSEFNQHYQEGKIRTILRARGPAFPNLNGQSISSVRVDSQHHMLSLASKVDPSPDWVVGLSGLELCLENCTWVEEKIINLYPWDIGTDAGPSYMSPDQPQVPPDVIRRIRHDYPNDPRSPFFNEDGEPMKPLAMLTIRRKKLYVKDCSEDESENPDKELPRECATHPFSAWSECSATCGQGTQWRRRAYKQPAVARIYNCDELTRNYLERTCMGNNCNGEANHNDNNIEANKEADCELSAWSEWSPCSKTCGEGKMVRRRDYVHADNEQVCQSQRLRKLLQYKKCVGRNCLGQETIASDEEDNIEVESQVENDAAQFSDRNENEEQDATSAVEAPENTKNLFSQDPVEEQIENEPKEREQEVEAEDDEILFDRNRYNRKQQNLDNYHNSRLNTNRGSWRQDEYNDDLYSNNINEEEANKDEEENWEQDDETSLDANKKWNRKSPKNSDYCFEKLQVLPCYDSTVTGNFWFYNYCSDECMLYAVDSCDMNSNKFKSLEACEAHCRRPELSKLRRRKQRTDCSTPRRYTG